MPRPSSSSPAPKGRPEIVLPRGFLAAGVAAGLKRSGAADMALFVSDRPAAVAGVFTTNQVRAAPVRLDQAKLRGRLARAIVVNSGNANACNGAAGLRDARRMSALTAAALDVPDAQVFVGSTGPIGRPLPMETIERGIVQLATALSPQGGPAAADAILTTDTRPKRWTATFRADGRPVTLTGCCKGAGMIEPKMGTMLAFLMTDAALAPAALQRALKAAADASFNRVTVDGDRSTNDTVLLLANGAAGNRPLTERHPAWKAFVAALGELTLQLAKMIARDGEGATKLITIRVRGARTPRDADLAARAVANSCLVKTAWAGRNANWGRVMDALGYSAAKVVEEKVDLWFDEKWAVKGGCGGPASHDSLREVIAREAFTVTADLHLGRGEAVVYTCNLTEEYVRVNV